MEKEFFQFKKIFSHRLMYFFNIIQICLQLVYIYFDKDHVLVFIKNNRIGLEYLHSITALRVIYHYIELLPVFVF